MPTSHLLYLHGFRSSPRSAKALRMAEWVATHQPDLVFACPQLPPSPAESIRELERMTAHWPPTSSAVIGSSLGGFYATVMAERLGWRCVLLNPAVNPARDLANHIGEQRCWQDPAERFFFRAEFVDELRMLAQDKLSEPLRQRYFAVIAKGDKVLNWREMLARYQAGQVLLLEGSDHGLSDFEAHLPAVLAFLDL